MSVFGNIMSSIFGHGAKAQPAPTSKSPAQGSSAPAANTGPAVGGANTCLRRARKVPLTVPAHQLPAQASPGRHNLNLMWRPF